MQRKATKNTRGPNAQEKAFHGWLKEQSCAYCGNPGPSIVDHARGATFKHQKVLIGHAFCTSKCEQCDMFKTHGSHRGHYEACEINESTAWIRKQGKWLDETGQCFPSEVILSISDFEKHEIRMYS